MATSIEISEARKGFNSLDERLKRDRVIYVRRHQKRVFAVVDLEFLDVAHGMIAALGDPRDAKILQQAIEDIRSGKPRPADEDSELS